MPKLECESHLADSDGEYSCTECEDMADKRDLDVMLLLTKMAERDERNQAEHEELRAPGSGLQGASVQ